MRSPMAKTWSSAASCSISKRPAFTPATRPACCPRSIFRSTLLATIREYTFRLARALKVVGLMNVQYAIQRDKVFVIEVNPRASRTVPYVSKATGVPLAKIAARLMTGRKLREFLPENIERGSRSRHRQLLLCEVAGLSLGQVSRRRHRAGPGDEVHRRSDGRGRQLRRGLRQSANRRRTDAADHRDGLHQRQRSRQALHGRSWRGASSSWASALSPRMAPRACWKRPACASSACTK